MGKKSRRKGTKRKYTYTKAEFMDIICPQCGLCAEGTEPFFCYDEVYKTNPKLFVRNIFRKLITETLPVAISSGILAEDDDDLEELFREIFCKSNFCKEYTPLDDNCPYIAGCMAAFRNQLNPGMIISISEVRNQQRRGGKKGKNKNKGRYVPVAYPSFFCNDEFRPEVNRILYGDSAEQQGEGEEPTGKFDTLHSRETNGS
jgi:hypothetical protein